MSNKVRKVAIVILSESIDFGLRLEILVLGWKCARKGQKQKRECFKALHVCNNTKKKMGMVSKD